MTAVNKSAAIFHATISGVVTLFASFWVSRWGFIQLWEWQHSGRRMVFIFDPEIKAALVAILSGMAVFLVLLWRSSRRTKV